MRTFQGCDKEKTTEMRLPPKHTFFFEICTASEDQYRTPSKEHNGNEVFLTRKNLAYNCS